jgi:hypothetical protein
LINGPQTPLLFYIFSSLISFTAAVFFFAGNHLESILFKIVFLMGFYHLFLSAQNNRTDTQRVDPVVSFFLLGLWAGFATWFSYAFLVVLLVTGIIWYIIKTDYPYRCYGMFFGGMVLGYSPAFFRLSQFGGGVKEEIFGQLFTNGWSRFFEKIADLWYIAMPGTSVLFIRLYWIGSFGMLVYLLWAYRRCLQDALPGLLPWKRIAATREQRIFPLLIYPLVYLCIFGFSSFDIVRGDTNYFHYRYIFDLFPFLSCVLALGIGRLWDSARWWPKTAGWCCLFFFVLIGLFDNRPHLYSRSFPQRHLLSDQGFTYEMLGTVISWRFKDDPRQALNYLDRIEEPYRNDGYRGFGFEGGILDVRDRLGEYKVLIRDTENWQAMKTGLIMGYAHLLYNGTELGESYPAFIRDLGKDRLEREFIRYAKKIQTFEQAFREKAYTGLGMQYQAVLPGALAVPEVLQPHIKTRYYPDFMKGVRLARQYPNINIDKQENEVE